MISLADVRLYVILDMPLLRRCGRDPLDVFWRAYRGGARMFQIRYKGVLEGELYRCAASIASEVRKTDALLIVNDSLSVALAVGADGVHLGSDDLPVAAARSVAGEGFIIGASTCSVDDAIAAQGQGADYIGYGAVFPTATKADAKLGSLDELKKVLAAVSIPVFPLGGINEGNVGMVASVGVDRVCVGSGVICADDPERAAAAIISALEERKS